MKRIHVRVTFINEALGTANANKDLHRDYIASKAPDAPSKEEEVEALGIDTVVEKGKTIFPKDADGTPLIWDYQIKGFFKAACSALRRCAGEDFAKASNKLKAHRKVIDGCIFVEPRAIKIDMHGGEMGSCQRPLRADTPQGARVSIADSETVPAGSTFECTVICLSNDYEEAVMEWLDYGQYNGLLSWRNSGKGQFYYEILNDSGKVIKTNKPSKAA